MISAQGTIYWKLFPAPVPRTDIHTQRPAPLQSLKCMLQCQSKVPYNGCRGCDQVSPRSNRRDATVRAGQHVSSHRGRLAHSRAVRLRHKTQSDKPQGLSAAAVAPVVPLTLCLWTQWLGQGRSQTACQLLLPTAGPRRSCHMSCVPRGMHPRQFQLNTRTAGSRRSCLSWMMLGSAADQACPRDCLISAASKFRSASAICRAVDSKGDGVLRRWRAKEC